MTLDSLHKVMTGESTLDKEMQIGEISHRADGDYRKVAQGKWVPVKAAGQAREFSETENHGAQLERQKKADAQAKKDEAVREQRAQGEAVGKSWKTAVEEWIKKNPNYKEMSADDIIKGISEHMAASEKPAEQPGGGEKANPYKADQDNFMRLLQEVEGKEYTDPAKVKVYRTDKGNWNVYYDGHRLGIYDKSELDSEAADELGWWERPAPDFDDEQGSFYEGDNDEAPAEEPKAEGGKRQLKRRADGTIIYETPDDVIYDMVENYNELDRGDLQGVIEAAAMSHGWDENEILEEVDRQAAEKYNLGVDSAPARLTRDTKIRLSQIKRKQTQDKKYNVGEISQKTGLQKQQDGSWAPPKQGRGSAYQESNKKVEALRGRGFNRTQLKNMRTSELDKLYESEIGGSAGGNSRTDGGLVWRSPDNKHRIHEDNSSGKTKYTLYERGDNYSRIIGEYDSPEAAVAAGEKINAPAGGKAEVNPITGKPLRPETVAYAKQKKAEAEQKRNTEKTAGGFTLAQNDKIKNAALDVITKRRGERLTAKDLQRDYKMSDEEANETVRRVNEYFENLQKDRKEFSKK